ncbi:2410_t:CDS:2, partial [Diversispora eburnea]
MILKWITSTTVTTVPTEVVINTNGQNTSVYATYLDPRVYAALISKKNANGTRLSDECYYISTPRPYENKSVSWDCDAGYYCFGPSNTSRFPCTDGFYCPENTQPVYCCAGYYCEDHKTIKLCPE